MKGRTKHEGEKLTLIGGSGGVSRWMWQKQLQAAPSYCNRVFHFGTEICTKPPFQHVAAEGICG